MTTTQTGIDAAAEPQDIGTIDMQLEVVTLPVSDVDRAKRFYQRLGWRLDADFIAGAGIRAVQFTPPRSNASIAFGTGLTTADPGSAQRLELVVNRLQALGQQAVQTVMDDPGHGYSLPLLDP